jgi:hypothetical protein
MARQQAHGTFKNGDPERHPIEEWPDGVSLVRLRIPIAYSGDLEGQGTTHYLAAPQKEGRRRSAQSSVSRARLPGAPARLSTNRRAHATTRAGVAVGT